MLVCLLGWSLLVLSERGLDPEDKEPMVRGKTASEWIDMLLKDPKVEHRRAALVALTLLGPKVGGVVPGICAALMDKEAGVRHQAAQTLGQMGPEAKQAAEPLAELLKSDRVESVREAAAKALGRLGLNSKPAIPDLIAALRDPHSGTRAAAVEALGRIGPEAKIALPNIMQLFEDSDHLVRRS